MVYKKLVDLGFSDLLFEAKAQTNTGDNLLKNFRSYVMVNPTTCSVVNNFIKEAKKCLYDSGVNEVYSAVCEFINDNKYSWSLASVCESSKKDYLTRNAIEKVQPLLEMNENDIVAYIKSGALKSVMYNESFRNIARSVYRDQPILEYVDNYQSIHPISFVEKTEDNTFFEVLGNIYKINDDGVCEAKRNEVSNDFIYISNLLESNLIKFDGDTLTLTLNENTKFEVNEQGKCTRTIKENKTELTIEQLRESNDLYLRTVANRKQTATILECFAKIVENFDNIVILNNANIITTSNDKFYLIEDANGSYIKSVYSKNNQKWDYKGNILECVNLAKKYAKVNLSNNYEDSIEEAVKETSDRESKMIKENLEREDVAKRKRKVEELTARYKNDPVRLQMLSKIANELAEL